MNTTDCSLLLDAQIHAQELLHWKIRYQTTLNTLATEAKRLSETERELAMFLDAYYDAIAQYLEELEQIEAAKAALFDMILPHAISAIEAQKSHDTGSTFQSSGYDAWVKQMFRIAARKHHPDMGGDEKEARAQMTALNLARAQGDVEALVRAAMPVAASNDAECLSALKAQCLELEGWKEALAMKREEIAQSAAYALYMKAFEARLAGRNWLAAVTQKLQREISQRKRQLYLHHHSAA